MLIYVRRPDGDEQSLSWDRLPESIGSRVLDLIDEIIHRRTARTFWERILSICSAHQEPDPNCKLCQSTPKDIFPDWDHATAQAEIAGLMKCRHCGFEFYRTTLICVACSKPAVELNLAQAMELAEKVIENASQLELRNPDLSDAGPAVKVIDSLYFHIRMALGTIRRLRGKEDDGKTGSG